MYNFWTYLEVFKVEESNGTIFGITEVLQFYDYVYLYVLQDSHATE